MNITDMLGEIASVAVAVERTMEILKPVYLAARNKIFKKEQSECTKVEKNVMTILLSIIICISMGIGIDIPGISEASIIQQVLAGLVASSGSSLLHMLLSILTGIKDTIEIHAIRMRKDVEGRL